MDCQDVEAALLVGHQPYPAALEQHLADCDACRCLAVDGVAVARDIVDPVVTPEILAALESSVLGIVHQDRGVVAAARALSRTTRLAIIGLVVGFEALFMHAYMRRLDWESYPSWRMALSVGAFGAVALVLAWFALRPMHLRPLPSWVERALLAVSIALPLVVAVVPAVPTANVPLFTYPAYSFRCLAYGLSLALVVILFARAVDRGGHALRGSTFLAVVSGGYSALLGLQLECPVNTPLHLLTGHATIPSLLALGSWWFRKT